MATVASIFNALIRWVVAIYVINSKCNSNNNNNNNIIVKGKVIPLQARCGPEGG